MDEEDIKAPISGRCYCGRITFRCEEMPQAIAYCHCIDCRRATGAAVAAFAAFDEAVVTFSPDEGQEVVANTEARRHFCPDCGSSLTGRYDYLPGQVYISIGVIDQADDLAPQLHAHNASRLQWLHIDDDLERIETTSRSKLNKAAQ